MQILCRRIAPRHQRNIVLSRLLRIFEDGGAGGGGDDGIGGIDNGANKEDDWLEQETMISLKLKRMVKEESDALQMTDAGPRISLAPSLPHASASKLLPVPASPMPPKVAAQTLGAQNFQVARAAASSSAASTLPHDLAILNANDISLSVALGLLTSNELEVQKKAVKILRIYLHNLTSNFTESRKNAVVKKNKNKNTYNTYHLVRFENKVRQSHKPWWLNIELGLNIFHASRYHILDIRKKCDVLKRWP